MTPLVGLRSQIPLHLQTRWGWGGVGWGGSTEVHVTVHVREVGSEDERARKR